MKKLVAFLVMAVLAINLWALPQIDSVVGKLNDIISDVKGKIASVEGKNDQDASRVIKYCDQLIANGYAKVTQLSYLVDKYKEQIGRRAYKKYQRQIDEFTCQLKKLKRAAQTGYLDEKAQKKMAKENAIKKEVASEKAIITKNARKEEEKREGDYLKLQEEIPVATSNPWEQVVLYDENIDRKIHNIYVVLNKAEDIVAASNQLPRFAARKEIGQMKAFLRDAEGYLKKMEYVSEKYSFRLKAMNKDRKVKQKIEKQRQNLKEMRRVINNFVNGKPVEEVAVKTKGKSLISKIKGVFSRKARKRNLVRVKRTFTYQEALPDPKEKYNDKLYIANNLDRVKKRFDFIEKSLSKIKLLNRASEEALKLSDEIGYWFRQSGRALKNIELKLEKNSFIFKHEGVYREWYKEYTSLMERKNELLKEFDDYKKGI